MEGSPLYARASLALLHEIMIITNVGRIFTLQSLYLYTDIVLNYTIYCTIYSKVSVAAGYLPGCIARAQARQAEA
jgi:hypothetical protein